MGGTSNPGEPMGAGPVLSVTNSGLHNMTRFYLIAATPLLAMLLSACAAPGAPRPQAMATAQQAKPAAPAVAAVELPKQELTRDILFKLLVAEVAGQRGEIGLASEAYADLARNTRDPRVARRATEAAMFAQNGDQALRSSQIWMETDPGDGQAAQTHASILVSAGEFDRAEPVLARLLTDQGPKTGAALLQIGSMLTRASDRTAALAMVTRLTAPYAAMPEANLVVAQIAFNAGDVDTALKRAQTASEQRRDWEAPVLFSAQVMGTRDPTAGLRLLEDARKRLPQSKPIALAHARALVASGQYPKALTEFKRLAAQFPNDGEIGVTVGALASQAGDADTAAQFLQQALNTDYAEKDAVVMMLGQIEAERGNASAALKWFESVRPGTASFMPAQVSAARVVMKQSGLAAARERLHALRTDSPLEQVQVILAEAQLLRESGDDRGAFDVLDAATREYAGVADLWYDHGMAAERLDMIEVVETSLRKVIELKPDHAHAYNALGFSLADRNVRLLEARGYIEQALQLSPDDPFIIDSLGWVQYRLGEFEDAEVSLRRAMALKDDPEVVAHLAEVLVKRDKRTEAGDLISKGLRKNPGNSVLQAVQTRLLP